MMVSILMGRKVDLPFSQWFGVLLLLAILLLPGIGWAASNQPPIAEAGNAQTVRVGSTVTLDGSGSTDKDGNILSYVWQQTGGETVKFDSTKTVKASFTAPNKAGVLTFKLTVKDNNGGTATDTVSITTKASNQSPSANAGADQTLAEKSTATLKGSGSDPDGDKLTYAWAQTDKSGVKATLSSASVATPTLTAPPVSKDTVLTFTLTVKDPGGLQATDTVDITVKNVNTAPTADAGAPFSITEKSTATLKGSGSDPDGDKLTYAWAQTDKSGAVMV